MSEKIILITGSTDGIGEQTALELAQKGHQIILHGRNQSKGEKTLNKIKTLTKNTNIEFILADLSSSKQIKNIVDDIYSNYDKLDVLINNAGVYENSRVLSEDGYEMTFAVNYLALFALTLLILPLLAKSAPSRTINISSMVHSSHIDFENLQGEKHFSGYEAYGLSKLCVILFTYALARKLKGTDITVNCLHPGVINTKLLRKSFSGGADVSEGAKTTVYLATAPEVEKVSGKYFVNKKVTESAAISYDEDIQQKLWLISEKFTKVKFEDLDFTRNK